MAAELKVGIGADISGFENALKEVSKQIDLFSAKVNNIKVPKIDVPKIDPIVIPPIPKPAPIVIPKPDTRDFELSLKDLGNKI